MATNNALIKSQTLAILAVTAAIATAPANAQLTLAGWQAFLYVAEGARYGSAIATGDFNGDGRPDLAVGLPARDIGGLSNSGAVELRLSNAAGGSTFGFIANCLDSEDIDSGYQLGAALVFGRFNDDAFDDLAIGMPGASAGAASSGGAVCVVYGGPLPYTRARFDQGALQGAPENGDLFGAVLAAGDLTGDGLDELVVGAPGESIGSGASEVNNAGALHVITGNAGGLAVAGNIILHEGVINAYDIEEAEDEYFGSAFAIGDFLPLTAGNELAVGVPGESDGGTVMIFSSQTGLLAQISIPINVESFSWDLLGTGLDGDEFGNSLATGDFNGDGKDDLAIGIPGDNDLSVQTEAGAVMVLYGSNTQLSDQNEQVFYESVIDGGNAGVSVFDRFGEVLASGDFNADGITDLAIGAPLDNSLGVGNSGEVTVLFGQPSGLAVLGVQIVDMIFFGSLDPNDNFGAALATEKLFTNAGGDDLIIGVPGRTYALLGGGVGSWPDTGLAIAVQSAALFLDGFETGDTSAWQ